MNEKFKLTTSSVKQRCRPPEPRETNGRGTPTNDKWYWDTEDKGFFLVVRRDSATFFVQRDVHGRTRRIKIGRYPTWTVDQARKRAKQLIMQMDQGVDPRRPVAEGTTLREALEWHLSGMRADQCAPRSMDGARWLVEHHLPDWVNRPLVDIRRDDCARRHERITRACGPYAANHALRAFRACWNTAVRRVEGLPECPVIAVKFNKERRRREPITWADLPAWRRAVDAIDNPIRRDLQLFILLTGLRATDAKTVRWEHVDFEAGTIHRPKPKGGEDRAFTVPVSAAVLALLRRRKDENAIIFPRDNGWAWPSRAMDGAVTHVQQVKEQRYVAGRKTTTFPSPHRLRDTFATAALEAGCDPLSVKLLMNHVVGNGDVTQGYQRPSVEHLRAQVEKVAAFLAARM